MSDSIRLRILKDAVAKLNAHTLQGSAPDAKRGDGMTAEVPSVLVYADEEESRRATSARSPVDLRHLKVRVEVRLLAEAGSPVDDEYDPFGQWIETLNGTVLDGALDQAAVVNTEWTNEQQKAYAYQLVTTIFDVPYSQRVGDATKQS